MVHCAKIKPQIENRIDTFVILDYNLIMIKANRDCFFVLQQQNT